MRIRTRLWLVMTTLLAVVLAGNALVVLRIETRELQMSFERHIMSILREPSTSWKPAESKVLIELYF